MVLQISHIGYRTERKIISVETPDECDILLKPKLLELDEIIVTATHEYLQQLTQDGGWDGEWSPDGLQVVFCSIQNGNSDIWIQPVVSETAIRWTKHPARDASPAWSPDGTVIAFTSYRDDTLKKGMLQPKPFGLFPLITGNLLNSQKVFGLSGLPMVKNCFFFARMTQALFVSYGQYLLREVRQKKSWKICQDC